MEVAASWHRVPKDKPGRLPKPTHLQFCTVARAGGAICSRQVTSEPSTGLFSEVTHGHSHLIHSLAQLQNTH